MKGLLFSKVARRLSSRRPRRGGGPDQLTAARYQRLVTAGGILAFAVLASASGYRFIGDGQWDWSECLYMAAITLSTVGFGETLPGMDALPLARSWTLVVIFMGSGTLLYFVSILTALIVEGDLGGTLRMKRMQRRIDRLQDHVIVCGSGRTGTHIVDELIATGTPFVLIDVDMENLQRLADEKGEKMLWITGDATDDDILREAGIDRAAGVVTALPDDRDNLFATVSARSLNPGLRIVAKCVGNESEAKLRRSGADAVVSPYNIGAMRMVSEMVRPTVVRFLDQMLRDRSRNLRIEQVAVPTGCPLDGVKLGDAGLRCWSNLLVMAVQETDGTYRYNPSCDYLLSGGMTLIVLAPSQELSLLARALVDGSYRPGAGPPDAEG
jgi:voltage-gated potassium channel